MKPRPDSIETEAQNNGKEKGNRIRRCEFRILFLLKRGVYEKVMCNRPSGFYSYNDTEKVCKILLKFCRKL